MVQTYTCRGCGFSWGPVGVQPYNPDATEHQLFLVCTACGQPQARTAATLAGLTCTACDATPLAPLTRCPRCGSDEAGWV